LGADFLLYDWIWPDMTKTRLLYAITASVVISSVAILAGCTSSSTSRSAVDVTTRKKSKEYFSESAYGVKASPRVTNQRSRLKRGGGRDQIGKPYQVRGRWYYPKEDPGYVKTGMASWYGDAFHGRLTANGEIYDMTNLTAAHPTMPLPSYARVTNVENGSSVIVRVNDRGPYERGRVIDLSHKAASMLGYADSGTAKVKVEYVGRAPVDGHDDAYLLASYLPGNQPADPSIGMPTGVMIAMSGATPTGEPALAFPGQLNTERQGVAALPQAEEAPVLGLPEIGPPVLKRPEQKMALASMSYGATQPTGAATAFSKLVGADQDGGWKAGATDEYLLAGSFATEAAAQDIGRRLTNFGTAKIEISKGEDRHKWYTLTLRAGPGTSLDDALRAAWAAGATDAMTVRN